MKVLDSVAFDSFKMRIVWVSSAVFVINCLLNVLSFKYHQDNTGSKMLFPEAAKNMTTEIPLELIRRLNMLSSVEEFFSNMVEPEELNLEDRMAQEPQERGSWRSGRVGKCTPEYTTISLKPNQTTTAFYYPRCVRVKRCSGCCLHDLFSCRPIETEIVPITVAVAEYRGGSQFRVKERKVVHIEEHKKCECGCKVQPQDCTKYQRYNAENCRCVCPNSERERKCHNKIWNPDVCTCTCRDELTCGTGFEFDPFSCRCVPPRGRKKPSFIYRLYV